MFWLIVAFIGLEILSYFLRKPAKSLAPAPGETLPPMVPAGTPIPVAFGTVRTEPIIVDFSYTLRPVITNGVVVAYGRFVTSINLLSWGPIIFSDIVWSNFKKLSAQGAQNLITSFDTSTFPPRVTTGTTSGAFSHNGFPDPARNNYSYAEIYLPLLFGGITPPGEGGIQGDYDGFLGIAVPCQSRSAYGGRYAFFPGGDPGSQALGLQPPIDDIKNFGTPPTPGAPGDCTTVPTTTGTGRIRYPRFGYVWIGGAEQGTSPQLPKQEFVFTSTLGGTINGGYDVNPISFLLRVLTDQEWGLGISESLIDLTNFGTVAGSFGDLAGLEHFGISGYLTQQQGGDEIIGEILRTVDAVLYRAPDTGLLSVQTIRGGYDLSGATALDETNCKELEWTRRDIADTVNEITVQYTDRDRDFTTNVVTVQDHANIHATGSVRSQTMQFPYISTEAQALQVAARELKANTLPLGSGTAVVSRAAWDAVPGDVIKVSWARYGLVNVACRVTSASSGNLDDGTVTLELAEDLFGMPEIPYTVDSGSYSPPVNVGAPTVQIEQSDDGVNGQASLIITSSESQVTLVEFSTQSGRSIPSGFATATGGPVYTSSTVALSATGDSFIYWRVSYTASDGSTQQLTGTVDFSVSGAGSTSGSGSQIVINDGLGGFADVFDSTADEVVSA